MIQKIILLLVSGLLLTGCHSLSHKKRCAFKKKGLSAYADIQSVSDSSVQGWARFEWAGKKKVKVTAEVTGLQPNGKVGFHVHEFGNCGNQALDAGAHFNPKQHQHGGPDHEEHHLGDFGNLEADAEGKAVYVKVVHGKVYKFLGRSVVVHAKTDDLKTQPTGASGGRVACGVVGAVAKAVPAEPSEAHSATEKEEVVTKAQEADQPSDQPVKAVPAVAAPAATSKPPVVKETEAVKKETSVTVESTPQSSGNTKPEAVKATTTVPSEGNTKQ